MSWYDYTIMSERFYNILGTLFTVALVSSSIGCLTTGIVCYNSGGWVSNKGDCINIYITGIIMSFISAIILLVGIILYIIEKCDECDECRNLPDNHSVGVTNPIPRQESLVGSPKLSPKRKHHPIQVFAR